MKTHAMDMHAHSPGRGDAVPVIGLTAFLPWSICLRHAGHPSLAEAALKT